MLEAGPGSLSPQWISETLVFLLDLILLKLINTSMDFWWSEALTVLLCLSVVILVRLDPAGFLSLQPIPEFGG